MPYSFRPAVPADAHSLARFHRLMFEEMARLEGRPIDPANLEQMETAGRDYFIRGLQDGSVLAWVVDAEAGEVVSAGAMTIRPCAPVPSNPSTRLGHLHSIYTLPIHRRQGHARQIVEVAIAWAQGEGLQSLTLNASQAGRGMYACLGFQPTDSAMRLDLPIA